MSAPARKTVTADDLAYIVGRLEWFAQHPNVDGSPREAWEVVSALRSHCVRVLRLVADDDSGDEYRLRAEARRRFESRVAEVADRL